jgi:glycosyltransferase involved in cell wall biosynthesis
MNVVVAALSAPAQMNGVSRHGGNLVRALLRSNAVSSIHFLAGEWQREMFRSTFSGLDSRVRLHWVSLHDANLSRLFWYYRELPCIAAQLDADIVHLTFPAPTGVAAYSCPTVLSLHDLYPFDIPSNFGVLRSALARHTINQCIRRVDAVACVSSSTRIALIRRYPTLARKSLVIPNAVEFQQSASASGGLESLKGRSFVLCIAQHRSNKNVPLAIDVFKRLLQESIVSVEARLVVVGNPGPETEAIEEKIRTARLTRRVLLYSGLSDAELRWCYENSDILLAPSSTEGFGLPVAEGLLAGSRIVCSNIPAFRELGGDRCRYVPWSGDPVPAYVQAIREVLALPRPRGVGLPLLSPATVGQQYMDLYSRLVCAPREEFDMLRQPWALENRRSSFRPE